jgi:hypothetical protein
MGGAIAIAVLGNALVLGLVFLIYRLGRASTTDQRSNGWYWVAGRCRVDSSDASSEEGRHL